MNRNEVEKSLCSIMNGDFSSKKYRFEKLSILSIKKNNALKAQSLNKIKDYGKLE